MKLSSHRGLWRALFSTLIIGAVLAPLLGMNRARQVKAKVPARTGYVNDFAQVVDETTRQRLDTILDNVKKRVELN